MKYTVHDIFTPSTIAKINYVERSQIDGRLLSALQTPGKQLVVFGHSGAGKTTLLRNILERTYSGEIFTHCMAGLSFESLIIDAFDQLAAYYINNTTTTHTVGIKGSLQSEYIGLKSTLEVAKQDQDTKNLQRIVQVQLTPQRLADFIGNCNYCWVLEDFHKMDVKEKTKLAQIMKVFMDKSVNYKELKIIALGAVNTGREVVEYDTEMRRRISEIEVKLMSESEIKEIITKGEELLNIQFTHDLKQSIIKYSNGLASVCHAICLYLCEEADVLETVEGNPIKFGKRELQKAIERYMDEESDTLKDKFDKAFRQKKAKYQNSKLILQALSGLSMDGGTHADIYRKIKDIRADYPQSNLSSYLDPLLMEDKGGLLRLDNASGKYSFSEPIYRTYALAMFANENASFISDGSVANMIGEIAFKILKEAIEKQYNIKAIKR